MHLDGWDVGEQVVERGPQRVNIGAAVGVFVAAGKLLQRGVGRGANAAQLGFSFRAVGIKQFYQAKIYQFNPVVQINPQVGRFDVAVNDGLRALVVQVVERVQHLIGPDNHRFFFERLPGAFQAAFQIIAFHVIHHQIFAVINNKIIGDFGQVGVIQPGQHTGFGQKLFTGAILHIYRCAGVRQIFFDGAAPSL